MKGHSERSKRNKHKHSLDRGWTRRRARLFELQKTGEAMRCVRQGDAWDAWDSESSVFQFDSKLFHVPRRSLKSFCHACVCPVVTKFLLTGFQCCILKNICGTRLVLVEFNPSFCGRHFNRLLPASSEDAWTWSSDVNCTQSGVSTGSAPAPKICAPDKRKKTPYVNTPNIMINLIIWYSLLPKVIWYIESKELSPKSRTMRLVIFGCNRKLWKQCCQVGRVMVCSMQSTAFPLWELPWN